MVNDTLAANLDAVIEDRARWICITLGLDPDEVLDEYGPVHRYDTVAYYIGEVARSVGDHYAEQIAESANCPLPADVVTIPRADLDAAIEALEKCREQFRLYAELHAAKGPDGFRKEQTNRAMMLYCDDNLAKLKGP